MQAVAAGVLLVEWSAGAGVASDTWARALLAALWQTSMAAQTWLVVRGYTPAQVLALRAELGDQPTPKIILADDEEGYQTWQQGLGVSARLCLGGDELALLWTDSEGRQCRFHVDTAALAAAQDRSEGVVDASVLPAVAWLPAAPHEAEAGQRAFSAGYFALPSDFMLLPLPPASAPESLWRARLSALAERLAGAQAGRPCILLGDGHVGEAERLAALWRDTPASYRVITDFAERQELYGLCGLYLAQDDTLEDRLSSAAASAAGAPIAGAALPDRQEPIPWRDLLTILLPERAFAGPVASAVPLARLFVDVSELIRQDAGTGIQRVVRHLLAELRARPPAGYRVQAVYASPGEHGYRCSDDVKLQPMASDAPLSACPGDRFLGLDYTPALSCQQAEQLLALRAAGVRVAFVLYDLLPVLMPAAFPAGTATAQALWLQLIATMDEVLCISQSVAREFQQWVAQELRTPCLAHVDWFHLGADLSEAGASSSRPADADERLRCLRQSPSFLLVGTLEPRKGIAQVVAAFEQLWQVGEDVHLVLVGKAGWQQEELIASLRRHPQRDHRLHWLEAVSDVYLEALYATCSCLLQASLGEGFGLPLVEAARRGLPLLVRDLPVFREVAGEHASYFRGESAAQLADAVQAWLTLYRQGRHTPSTALPWQTWRDSAEQLIERWLTPRPMTQLPPPARTASDDENVATALLARIGRQSGDQEQQMRLLHERMISLYASHEHIKNELFAASQQREQCLQAEVTRLRQLQSDSAQRERSLQEERQSLQAEVTRLRVEQAQMQSDSAQREQRLQEAYQALITSSSWRLTRPLRVLARVLRRLPQRPALLPLRVAALRWLLRHPRLKRFLQALVAVSPGLSQRLAAHARGVLAVTPVPVYTPPLDSALSPRARHFLAALRQARERRGDH